MGGGKRSIKGVNTYKMNKQKQPLSGSVDGKKKQSHNNTMSLEVHKERKKNRQHILEGGERIQ
jgi:hypothetical protein